MTQTLSRIISGFFIIGLLSVGLTRGAHVYFGEDNGIFTQNCTFRLDIMLDTQGEEITTAGIAIIDNDGYQILNFDYSGGIFASYTSLVKGYSKQKEFLGKEYSYMMGTNAGSTKFKGVGKFSSVIIKPDNGAKEVLIKFYAIKSFGGDDSNIIIYTGGKSVDILNSFKHGNYKLLKGECIDDTIVNNYADTKLNKNDNVDMSKYPSGIDQTNVDHIVMIQKSKLLFWLSENKAILLILGIALTILGLLIKKKVNGKNNYSGSVSIPFQPTPPQTTSPTYPNQ